jgi:hypothetical protein
MNFSARVFCDEPAFAAEGKFTQMEINFVIEKENEYLILPFPELLLKGRRQSLHQ